MGLFKSKETKAFEQELSALRKAITVYNQDDASKKQIDEALNAAKMRMSEVSNLVKHLSDKDSAMVLASIAFTQSRLGNIKQAIEIAQGIKDKDVCSRALIDIAAVQADNLVQAIETLQKMPDKGLLSEQLRNISVAKALSGDLEQAVKTAQDIPLEDYRRILEFFEIARAWSGDIQEATKAAQKTRDQEKLVGIAFTHALSGDMQQAIETAKETEPSICSNFLNSFVAAHAWLGNTEQVIEIARNIPDESLRGIFIGAVIMSHAMTSTWPNSKVIKTIREIPDESLRSAIMGTIITKQVLLGNMEDTMKVLEEIGDEDIRSDTLENIAKILTVFTIPSQRM